MVPFNRSTGPRAGFGAALSPKAINSGQAMTKSTLPPEIMLRDPLDQEFVLNRKMAKKFYDDQLKERMLENKNKVYEDTDGKKKQLQKKEELAAKRIADQRKAEGDILNL